jgi:hypothetical protein
MTPVEKASHLNVPSLADFLKTDPSAAYWNAQAMAPSLPPSTWTPELEQELHGLLTQAVQRRRAVEQALAAKIARLATSGETMKTPPTPDSSTQLLLAHFRSIKDLGGEQRLRQTLSAARKVTARDRQMTPVEKASHLKNLDAVEAELLPAPSSPASPPSAAPQ